MNTAPRKILVVDNEAIPRMLLSTNLAEAGYIVQDADSGKKPCNCFEKNLSMLKNGKQFLPLLFRLCKLGQKANQTLQEIFHHQRVLPDEVLFPPLLHVLKGQRV